MQLSLKLRTNTKRNTIIVDSETATPKSVLTEAGVDYSTTTTHLDGGPLSPAEMNKPFAELVGATTEECILSAVVKSDNAIN